MAFLLHVKAAQRSRDLTSSFGLMLDTEEDLLAMLLRSYTFVYFG